MAFPRRQRRAAQDEDPVVVRLADGHYDHLLADFQAQLEAATEELRRIHEAMRAENTLRS